MGKRIISEIDGESYSCENSHFSRHLKKHGLTYQEYYEKFITGITEICEFCGMSKKFYRKNHEYGDTCGSPKCVGKKVSQVKSLHTDEYKQEINQKRKQTNIEKYGVESVSQHNEFKEKAKETMQQVMPDGRKLIDHVSEHIEVVKLAKYGNSKYNNNEKISATKMKRTVEQNNITNEKKRKTNLERYGVECPLMMDGVMVKANKGNCSIKNYTLPSGNIVGIRGHEPIVLGKLLLEYGEHDITIHDNNTKKSCINLEYRTIDNRLNKYYPDIHIKSINKIIEVKSPWWWDGYGKAKYHSRLFNNLRKAKAAIDNGYEYEVWIYDEPKKKWEFLFRKDLEKMFKEYNV